MKIGVIGAGWVGVTTAATLAHLGHDVVCSDIHAERVAKLQGGALSFYEPGLEELLKEGLESLRLNFTASNEEVCRHAEIVFVCVDTPASPDGAADLSQVMAVARDFAKWHTENSIFVIKSTVPAGTCRKMTQLITEASAMSGNTGSFAVATNPEFLAESTAVRDSLQPSRVVIGADDVATRNRVKEVFAPLTEKSNKEIPFMLTDATSAEIIKCASNAYLATRISFVNEIANYAVAVGGDPYEVTRGMSFDPRIGNVRPGVGFGGGCFPKDVRSLLHEGAQAGAPFSILEKASEVNQAQRERLYGLLRSTLDEKLRGKKIAVLGLAFKPNTDDIREAPAQYFIEHLLAEGAEVQMYDPKAGKKMARQFSSAKLCSTLSEAIDGTDAVVVLTEWDEFSAYSLNELKSRMRGSLVVDGRGVWPVKELIKLGFEVCR